MTYAWNPEYIGKMKIWTFRSRKIIRSVVLGYKNNQVLLTPLIIMEDDVFRAIFK